MVLIEESPSDAGDRIEDAAAAAPAPKPDAAAAAPAPKPDAAAAAPEPKPDAAAAAASEKPAEDEDTFEDALDEEQLEQRVLSQANDAKAEGNRLFGAGSYDEALVKYEHAMQIAPEGPSATELRSICHANRAACFSKLGRYDDTVKECTKALKLNATYMKALVRRGEAQEKLEHYEEAIADMKKIIELDPSNAQAGRSLRRLEPLAAEKQEKMKQEMIGKFKEIGTSVLGWFGLSLDNFKTEQDPKTGSYSLSYQG